MNKVLGAGSPPVATPGRDNQGRPIGGPTGVLQYGAITYDHDAGSQVYVLYATGKSAQNAVIADSVSNN
jgi:hypothetical protein